MKDPRMSKLAELLVHHSTRLQEGENVLIEVIDTPEPLIGEILKAVYRIGANPFLSIKQNRLNRLLLLNANEQQLGLIGSTELALMKEMDAYIAVRGGDNVNELSDVPAAKMKLYQQQILRPVHLKERVNNTRWVVMRYPSSSFAQSAGMSSEAFEDFFYNVCTMDYGKMELAMQPLIKLMEQTDQVRITSPGTDLRFSIKGIPVIGCSGMHNIPDGEVFTAPVRDSVNGRLRYNTPTIYQGTTFNEVELEFRDGCIVDYKSENNARLKEIFDTDEGARYVGEFAIAFNPYVVNPMLDILFDEKIAGSLHFTPGQAYELADNGNRSDIHWDMVLRQSPQAGGGEIYFDERLIRKDGLFVHDNLLGLNPENLK